MCILTWLLAFKRATIHHHNSRTAKLCPVKFRGLKKLPYMFKTTMYHRVKFVALDALRTFFRSPTLRGSTLQTPIMHSNSCSFEPSQNALCIKSVAILLRIVIVAKSNLIYVLMYLVRVYIFDFGTCIVNLSLQLNYDWSREFWIIIYYKCK